MAIVRRSWYRPRPRVAPEVLFLAALFALAICGYLAVARGSAGGAVFKSDAPACADARVPCRGRAV